VKLFFKKKGKKKKKESGPKGGVRVGGVYLFFTYSRGKRGGEKGSFNILKPTPRKRGGREDTPEKKKIRTYHSLKGEKKRKGIRRLSSILLRKGDLGEEKEK